MPFLLAHVMCHVAFHADTPLADVAHAAIANRTDLLLLLLLAMTLVQTLLLMCLHE